MYILRLLKVSNFFCIQSVWLINLYPFCHPSAVFKLELSDGIVLQHWSYFMIQQKIFAPTICYFINSNIWHTLKSWDKRSSYRSSTINFLTYFNQTSCPQLTVVDSPCSQANHLGLRIVKCADYSKSIKKYYLYQVCVLASKST